jgi:hypothetical protein
LKPPPERRLRRANILHLPCSTTLNQPSPALPGAVHNVRAAREHRIIDTLTEADLACWADKAYQGAGGTVRVPTAAGGRRFPPVSKRSTDPTPRSEPSSNKPSPPSNPGGSSANSAAHPPEPQAWFRPSSPYIWPTQAEDGERSLAKPPLREMLLCAAPVPTRARSRGQRRTASPARGWSHLGYPVIS